MASEKRIEYAILRRRCVEMKWQDWPQHQIAKALGMSEPWVSRTLKAFLEKGQEGIASRSAPGNQPKLSPEQVQTLLEALNQGAEAHGFAGHVWTRKRVNAVIEKLFGVSYDPTQIGRILRKAGWSLQRPQRKARQQSETAVTSWKQERLPVLKKS